jgi:hypothetical protein
MYAELYLHLSYLAQTRPSSLLQQSSGGAAKYTYLEPCNANDQYQQWAFAGATGAASTLQNVGSKLCADSSQK